MKNKLIAKEIKKLRKRKGFSQEKLAEDTGLSLSTIQRIENGETEPRGHTLQRLAASFGILPDKITNWEIIEDPYIIKLLSYTQLSFLAFPVLGILIPFIIWIQKKDTVKGLEKLGKSILNFQITWTITLFLIYIILALSIIFSKPSIYNTKTIYITIVGLYLFNVFMIFLNTIRCTKMKKTYYIPAIRILR
ncbi:MAG: helix-turn-helix domain-containing protein [Bacteroidales bacterium]|nr:helix-turn-helix domain-containing protein [Bacteroidales bacterium]